MVSVVRIRLDSRKSVRPFKGIFCDDISEFESCQPSHAVGSQGTSAICGALLTGARHEQLIGASAGSHFSIERAITAIKVGRIPRESGRYLVGSAQLGEQFEMGNVASRPQEFVGGFVDFLLGRSARHPR
jgi:hypothetical protein